MTALRSTRVKVCCISSLEEARAAIEAGADAIGLVSAMPSGPGVIGEELIREIARSIPPSVATFLLTCHQRAEDIVLQHRRCGTTTIQLCDRLVEGNYSDLRSGLPGVALVQVIHVLGPESVEEARTVAGEVDAILLDSGNPALARKELGGTGRTHDWGSSAQIRRVVGVPVFLAGGLSAANVAQAVDQVEPWGVDLCSSVRTDGRLDSAKLREFMLAIRRPS